MEAKMEMINDKPPTGTVSWSRSAHLSHTTRRLQFANFLVNKNPENLFADLAASCMLRTRHSLGGFIAFLCTEYSPKQRSMTCAFNMQQAIYLDIALFTPQPACGAICTR
jgi:hypothetical protein